jgi:membrane protease YdiL (CAAX protease family)
MAQQIHEGWSGRVLPTTPGTGTPAWRRKAEAIAFVAVWVAAGYLLPISSNVYLLLGIPLTIGFQLVVRRRPVRELFAAGTDRFRLDRRGAIVAAALGAVPLAFAVRSTVTGDWSGLGWYLAATIGAVCAAFALRAGGVRSALRAAALPVAVGSTGMALVYTGIHIATGVPLSVRAIAESLLLYTALYFPATFLLEEVSFRGAIDAHVHHPGERRGLGSAVFVSVLWGLWHLPVSRGLPFPFPLQVAELVVVHVALGVPLSIAWRRTRNLAGPGLAHAVNDAVRNGFMTGL